MIIFLKLLLRLILVQYNEQNGLFFCKILQIAV